jgi:hypothetical protein
VCGAERGALLLPAAAAVRVFSACAQPARRAERCREQHQQPAEPGLRGHTLHIPAAPALDAGHSRGRLPSSSVRCCCAVAGGTAAPCSQHQQRHRRGHLGCAESAAGCCSPVSSRRQQRVAAACRQPPAQQLRVCVLAQPCQFGSKPDAGAAVGARLRHASQHLRCQPQFWRLLCSTAAAGAAADSLQPPTPAVARTHQSGC